MNNNTIEVKMKVCSKCGVEKELNTDNFSRHKGHKDGFNTQCKECRRKLDAERYKKKRDEILKQKKTYYQENKEKVKERQKNYYHKNVEDCKRREKVWRKNNPHKKRTINERRRTRERKLPTTLTAKEWKDIKAIFNNSCAYCGMSEKEHLKVNGELLHQEHFIPLLKGGTHDKSNIIPSCRSCNSSKSNHLFNEWYPKQKYYDKEKERKILRYLSTC